MERAPQPPAHRRPEAFGALVEGLWDAHGRRALKGARPRRIKQNNDQPGATLNQHDPQQVAGRRRKLSPGGIGEPPQI